MALGILQGAGVRQVSGLGAVSYWCWDQPGFKDCAAKQDLKANTECREDFARGQQSGYASQADCYQKKAESYIIAGCACPKTDPKKPKVTAPSSSSFAPSLEPPVESETKILGLPLKTVGLVALAAYAAYELFGKPTGKKEKA